MTFALLNKLKKTNETLRNPMFSRQVCVTFVVLTFHSYSYKREQKLHLYYIINKEGERRQFQVAMERNSSRHKPPLGESYKKCFDLPHLKKSK